MYADISETNQNTVISSLLNVLSTLSG